jgi:hypothetical protein
MLMQEMNLKHEERMMMLVDSKSAFDLLSLEDKQF